MDEQAVEMTEELAEVTATDDAGQDNVVTTLSEVLGDEAPVTEDPEPEPDDQPAADQTDGEDAAQEDAQQAAIDKALWQRLQAERQKLEQRHAPDRAMAESVRALYPGMTPEQVRKELLSARAARLAEEKGIDAELAMHIVQLEAKQVVPAAEQQHNERIQALAAQAKWLTDNGGADMLAVLKNDAELRERVHAGEMDIYQAHALYQQRAVVQKKKSTAPPAVRSGGRSAQINIEKMSPEAFARLTRQLERGDHIALE